MSDSFCIVFFSSLVCTNYFFFFFFSMKLEHCLRGMISEDVTDDEKEGLNLEYPAPSYTTLELHSPASAASASNFPSGIKSSSGIIFSVYFSLFLLLKISKPFLPGVIFSHYYYTECYIMPMNS